jgi:hypothetical protein
LLTLTIYLGYRLISWFAVIKVRVLTPIMISIAYSLSVCTHSAIMIIFCYSSLYINIVLPPESIPVCLNSVDTVASQSDQLIAFLSVLNQGLVLVSHCMLLASPAEVLSPGEFCSLKGQSEGFTHVQCVSTPPSPSNHRLIQPFD